ncbi:MAG TPA: two-component regulator propeller domain-containing protein [Candidatus Dormibacteraeota bacterium]|nr:two-component regulator propeller domain-containing protein [Candidatus Dormibacteraeota bacterium]
MVLLTPPANAFNFNKPLTEYTHTVWTHKDGIPSAFIYSIAQTGDGYLWLATTDGLVRFDGVRFVHWRPKTGHTELLGVVRSLCAARDGSLWIGTAAGLVGHIREDDLTTFPVGAPVEAILEDHDRTLWVTTENYVSRFRAATQEQIGTAITLPGTFLSGPLQDRSGSIWLTTHSQVLRLDSGNEQRPPLQIAKGKFWLSEDTNADIWLTRSDGSTRPVNEWKFLGRPDTEIKTLDVYTVLRDTNGNTWIGTLGQGLARLRPGFHDGLKMEKYSPFDGLSAARVLCFLEDREHNIWVGTQNGLNRFRDEKITTLTRREGLLSDNIDALGAGPDGTIWASTPMGVHRIDGQHRDLHLNGTGILGLHVDRKNTLWAGTNRGVARMQGGKWEYLPIPTQTQLTTVTAITGDDEDGVWFVDDRKGLYRWMNGRITDFSEEPLFKGKSILAAQADAAGRVWFGLYEGGVVVFDGSRFHAYSESDGLAGGSVNVVYVDDKATVWIGAERGLSRFDGQRFLTWNRANGLPGDRVQWVLTDSGDRTWLGYSTGVAYLSSSELDKAARDSSYRIAFQFLDDADGLKGNPDRRWQSPAVRASDGSLWFRTSEGVAIIDPQHMTRNLVRPPVHIERLLADGGVADTLQPARLRPLTRDVEIDYTALSFAEPRNVRFRYKLEGFDSEWRDVGARRQAFYTNLHPRTYRFRVLACNNDGIWNESGAGLDFTLLPAFYQTHSFLLLCALVLIIFAWSAYRLRVWQVTTHLQDRFEDRLNERTRIAQELHDNLIQDVMGISLQIEVTDELLPSNFPAKQSLARAVDLCKSALDAGRRALNDLRTVPLSAADLVKSFSQLANDLASDMGTVVDVIVEGHERPLNALTGNDVLQVGRQAITNAFQHARATRINVLLSYGQQQLQIRIQDNGRGVSEETLNLRRPGHYGITGMQERAERLGTSISIRSRIGKGTEVNLSVPAHLIYQESLPRSGSRLADKWNYVTGRLRVPKPKPVSESQGAPPEKGSQTDKRDERNS